MEATQRLKRISNIVAILLADHIAPVCPVLEASSRIVIDQISSTLISTVKRHRLVRACILDLMKRQASFRIYHGIPRESYGNHPDFSVSSSSLAMLLGAGLFVLNERQLSRIAEPETWEMMTIFASDQTANRIGSHTNDHLLEEAARKTRRFGGNALLIHSSEGSQPRNSEHPSRIDQGVGRTSSARETKPIVHGPQQVEVSGS
jgi:hypothetical protein